MVWVPLNKASGVPSEETGVAHYIDGFVCCKLKQKLHRGLKTKCQNILQLIINCSGPFKLEQIEVATRRVSSEASLQMLVYTDNTANLKHPEEVKSFYVKVSMQLQGNRTECCSISMCK